MLIEQRQISEQFFSSAFLADDLFSGLSTESQNSLLAVKTRQQFAENETIFAGGETPRGIFVLAAGEAEIFYHGSRTVHPVRQNEILGLTEAVANLPYEISVRTTAPCRFEYIRREDFIAFLQAEPATCFRLLQMVGTNLHKLYQFLH